MTKTKKAGEPTYQPKKVRRLFWDIETAPNIGLFWRAGFDQSILTDSIVQERKVINICYKWEGDAKVHSLTWDKNQNDRAMLEAFSEILDEADEIVAHFGDRFDLPWVKTRMLFFGLAPIPPQKTIDTKSWASRNFYFQSNKLDYIGQFLGEGKKIKTDYDLWKDILLKRCPKAMAKMVAYCKQDVILLERVYARLAEWCKPKSHAGVMGGLDKWTCPRTGSTDVSKSKTRVTAAGTVQHQMKNVKTGAFYTINDAAYKQYLQYRKDKLSKVRLDAEKRNRKGRNKVSPR